MLLALPLSPILFAGFHPAPPHPQPAARPDVPPHVALLYTSVCLVRSSTSFSCRLMLVILDLYSGLSSIAFREFN